MLLNVYINLENTLAFRTSSVLTSCVWSENFIPHGLTITTIHKTTLHWHPTENERRVKNKMTQKQVEAAQHVRKAEQELDWNK